MNYRFDTVKPEYYDSIRDYRNEFLACEPSFDGCNKLNEYDDIEKWDFNCKLFENINTLPPGYSMSFVYVYLDDNEVVGMFDIRPNAMEHYYLKQYGGHVGYNIKPSKRNMGIGTKMLEDCLMLCKNKYNLNRILITCRKDNVASRKIILNNGGVLETDVYCPPEECRIERYWIEL